MDAELPKAEKKARKPKLEGEASKPRARKVKAESMETEKPKAETGGKMSRDTFKPEGKPSQLLAIVRVRGLVGVDRKIGDTLRMLMLDRVNHCVIVPKNPSFEGMAKKAAYFLTWGEISRETLEKLVVKRGRFAGDKRVTDEKYAKEIADLIVSGKSVKDTGIKPVFRLSPPSKGYQHTKILFPRGALGYRGEKINELIKKMI
jgi:large subunit ribosomal protein L30